MRLLSVKVAGFRGVRGEITLTFPSGFAVITGANGAGKSTVCDAIEYALCGTLSRINPAKESGEGIAEYIWWRGKQKPTARFVHLELERDDGTIFSITREPSGLKNCTEQAIVDCLCDKSSRPADSVNYLVRTSVLRGEQIAELSLDLPEADRFSFVKACLGARDHSEIEAAASALAKAFKAHGERLDQEYERQRFRITDITSRISSLKAQALKIEDISGAESLLRRELQIPDSDLLSLAREGRAKLSELKGKLDLIQTAIRRLTVAEQKLSALSTDEYRSRIASLQASLAELQKRLADQRATTTALEESIRTSSQLDPSFQAWAALHEHGTFLGLQDGKCPLCTSPVSLERFQESLKSIKDRIEAESKTAADLLQRRNVASDELRKLSSQLASLERELKDMSSQAEILSLEKNSAIRTLNELGFSGPDLQTLATARAESIREEASRLDNKLSILEGSKALEVVGGLEKDLIKLQKETEALARQVSKARSSEERFKEAAATVKRVSGELVDEKLAELSPLLAELYSRLKPHVDWPTVSYITRGDVRRFLSLRIGDDLNPRFMFSNGQRRAAGLAFLLSVHLSRSWCQLNSLILDDPVQHIDDFRALHLVEVLSAIRQTGKQVLCTIEDPELAKLLCRRLRSTEDQEGRFFVLDYQSEAGVTLKEEKAILPLPKNVILAA